VTGLDSWLTAALPGAVSYASSLLGDQTQGDDIVQDCVCRLLRRAAHYDLPRDGRKLLFRAITNACINARSRGQKAISLDEYGRHLGDGAWEVEDAAAVPPPVVAVAEELRQAIADGLKELPVPQRSALQLSSLGYRPDEIAEMLNVKPDYARVILFRGRKAMAQFLNTRFPGRVTP
jgi:RNA polymerase sigma factor (sigma-70 family)